jgi:hypothetical protein
MGEIIPQHRSAERYAEAGHFVPALGIPVLEISIRAQASESLILAAATACSPRRSLPPAPRSWALTLRLTWLPQLVRAVSM